MLLRHYSLRTEQAYVGWIRRYICFTAKPKKLLDQLLFRVLASKDQGNNQTQNANNCHHSQDGWNAEFTL